MRINRNAVRIIGSTITADKGHAVGFALSLVSLAAVVYGWSQSGPMGIDYVLGMIVGSIITAKLLVRSAAGLYDTYGDVVALDDFERKTAALVKD